MTPERVCAFCGAQDDGSFHWSEAVGGWFCEEDSGFICTDTCDHAAGVYHCEPLDNDGSSDGDG